jgi:response regulator RpfG family c-di-GMP phosphodiesterase
MRAIAHYAISVILLGVYGGQVCPLVDELDPIRWWAEVAIVFLVVFAARVAIIRLLIEPAPLDRQTRRQLVVEASMYITAALIVSGYNYILYNFPVHSAAKITTGFVLLGFFAAMDLALERERIVALKAADLGVSAPMDIRRIFPLTTKFALAASATAILATIVVFLVIAKDMGLEMEGTNWDPKLIILGEISFVGAVILLQTLNLVASFSKNLNLFLNRQNNALMAVDEGNLATMVPVSGHDEFGVMAVYTNSMIESLRRRTAEAQITQDVTMLALASLAETRDNETGAHILRTQRYVRALADRLRDKPGFTEHLNPASIELLYKSAPLHDIGKVGVRDAVLLKPGKLTDEEFAEMKMHPKYGSDALLRAEAQLGETSFLRLAREIAYGHHEKWDGSGYPEGIKGDAIPLSARLMALADVYDALISKRVYKPAFTHEQAKEIIIKGRGSHFDPVVVEAFEKAEDDFTAIKAKYADSHGEG